MSLADDRIDDCDVGPLWAEHYPQRIDNILSKALCLILFYVIADRAHSIYPHGDWMEKDSTRAPVLWVSQKISIMKLERMPLIRDSDAGKEPESDLLKAGQLLFFPKKLKL
jgi:hypothetical protein